MVLFSGLKVRLLCVSSADNAELSETERPECKEKLFSLYQICLDCCLS